VYIISNEKSNFIPNNAFKTTENAEVNLAKRKTY
jgi:hypothetical protein